MKLNKKLWILPAAVLAFALYAYLHGAPGSQKDSIVPEPPKPKPQAVFYPPTPAPAPKKAVPLAPNPPSRAPEISKTRLPYKLVSTLSIGDGTDGRSSAMIKQIGGQPKFYAVGEKDSFYDGVTITRILPNRVEFLNRSTPEYLDLDQSSKPGPAAAASPSNPNTVPPNLGWQNYGSTPQTPATSFQPMGRISPGQLFPTGENGNGLMLPQSNAPVRTHNLADP